MIATDGRSDEIMDKLDTALDRFETETGLG